MKNKQFNSKKIINGYEVPDNLSIPELTSMLGSSNMTDFALACEALVGSKTKDIYSLLMQYLDDPDKYKRRYVWSKIFEFPDATELLDRFVDNFYSTDSMVVIMALMLRLNMVCLLQNLLYGMQSIGITR